MKGTTDADGRRDRVRRALVLVAIVLLAANLRPAITSVAPLIERIRADAGVSNGVAGLLTALPLLAFAALSPLAPRLARHFGAERVLIGSMLVLCAGILLRSSGTGAATLFAGTAVLGAAIAAGNVLLPGLVKEKFSGRIGAATGVYTVAMGTSAAIAAGASVPLTRLLGPGWQASLALWAAPALLAAVAWAPLLGRGGRNPETQGQARASPAAGLWRSPLAWQVTAFMGLQSLGYYATLTWLPEILREGGTSAEAAGWLLALSQAVAIPAMFVAPVAAGRSTSQRGVVAVAVALIGAGVLGLLLFGAAGGILWVTLLGLGQGACFSLALTLFALRAADPDQAAALSGMAQSFGYLLAALGPTVFGVLRDATGSWTLPLALLLVITACLLAAGLGAGRDARVGLPA
ncbi:MAG TPA: MFS transporter [Rubrobacter sp.]|nr:MFS transporter [Rubrobacter sp.]